MRRVSYCAPCHIIIITRLWGDGISTWFSPLENGKSEKKQSETSSLV